MFNIAVSACDLSTSCKFSESSMSELECEMKKSIAPGIGTLDRCGDVEVIADVSHEKALVEILDSIEGDFTKIFYVDVRSLDSVGHSARIAESCHIAGPVLMMQWIHGVHVYPIETCRWFFNVCR